ncbi:MAG: HAMP domain-containing protein [Lachnospiraceae bacterium]|nr:HAMP domain-containing protein [Lachnospiraceae bacterium]
MGTKKKQKTAKHGQAAQLRLLVRQAFIAIGTGIVMMLLSVMANAFLTSKQTELLHTVDALNQYRLGSKTLTSDVQSYAVTGDQQYYDAYMKELEQDQNREQAIAVLEKCNLSEEDWAALDQIAGMSDGLVPLEEAAMQNVKDGDLEAARAQVFGNQYEQTIVQINEQTSAVIQTIEERKTAITSIWKVIQLIAQLLFMASFFYVAVQVVRTIKFAREELLYPIQKVSADMTVLAGGDFSTRLDLKEDDSEVGRMVSSISFMKQNLHDMLQEISRILEQMGNGNYQIQFQKEYIGEFTEIKDSFLAISGKMRETLNTLREVSDQIDKGSEQLSSAAQDLAEGSTTQAGQVSELAEVIRDMTQNMERNAVEASESVKIAAQAGETLNEGNAKMQELKEAIREINRCSEQISTIIGAIEDIASQTNLLSLNAAIEAARAGEAGRGFAVVAGQVKSLAEESAKAAGQTTQLIETTVAAVDKGIRIADETAVSMENVMEGAKAATEKMGQIAQILNENVKHMRRVEEGMFQVSSVVDNNSASSQETAAVSEEQKAQVETMVQLMERFEI